MPGHADHRPDLRLLVALGGIVGGTTAAVAWWALTVRDRLPDPVAHHWGIGGRADGFSSLEATLLMTGGFVVIAAAPMVFAAAFSRQPVPLRRTLAALVAFLAVFVNVLSADALRGQLDLADASSAPLPGPGLLAGIILGTAAAVVAAALVRRPFPGSARAKAAPPSGAIRLQRPEPELRWQAGPEGMDTAAKVVAGVAALGLGAVSALVSWWLLPLALLVVGLLLGSGRIGTIVDEDGLSARVLGLRVLHVPLTEVAEADVVDVDPFWEFGGWGLRVDMAGRVGLVTRKGPAVRIRRDDDTEVLVTVDDAVGVAATINTLADRLDRT